MHEFRTAILTGEKFDDTPVAKKEKCRRRIAGIGATLVDIAIPREERRATNQRREDRFHGVVERATIVFRRKKQLVRVVNVSEGGVMIECNVMPRIGETIGIHFEGFDALEGKVRWVKQGRVGLDVGDGSISLS